MIARNHLKQRRRRKGKQSSRFRRLLCEALEDRRLLAVSPFHELLPGMELVAPDLDKIRGQIIYLDFDGEEDVVYNGPVTVGPFDVPAFNAEAIGLPGLEHELLSTITAQVSELVEPLDVIVTADRPNLSEYSIIYIGGADDAFAAHGDFFGLAEAVDVGNVNHRDEGFVFSEEVAAAGLSFDQYLNAITSVAAHEAGHLLGFEHFDDGLTHLFTGAVAGTGDSLLDAVAHKREEDEEVHQWITKEAYDFYRSQFDFGNSNSGWGELGAFLIGEDGSGNELTPGSSWAQIAGASNTYDGDNNIIEGASDEDTSNNPGGFTYPYLRHFCAGADGLELTDGLSYADMTVNIGVPDEHQNHFYSAYEWASMLWNGWEDGFGAIELYDVPGMRGLSYWYLGHVAHLLQDMTVPAHVHNDEHPLDEDYEETVADHENFRLWEYGGTDSDAVRSSPTRMISLSSTLESLFRETTDYTEEYDSNNADGDDEAGIPNTGRHHPDLVSRSGGFTGDGQDLTPSSSNEVTILADDLMPWAIEQTSALFRLFYHEVDASPPQVTQIEVKLNSQYQSVSTDFWQPTIVNTERLDFSGVASDPESGIGKNLFEYHTARWDELTRQFVDWTDHGPGPNGQELGPFDEGRYLISLTAENGAGIQKDFPVGHFQVETPVWNQLPEIGSLAAQPDVVDQGDPLTLTAFGVRDDDGSVQEVQFSWDSNGSGQWEAGDTYLDHDTSISGEQASVTISTAGLPTETVRFFARALDNDGGWTYFPATTTAEVVGVTNQPPSIASLSGPASVQQGQLLTLTAHGVSDSDGVVSRVQFYRDSNANGKWDTADKPLGSDTSIVSQQASIRIPATFPVGTQRFFARAKDDDGLWSGARSTTVTVTGVPGSQDPTVHWVSRSPATVKPGDQLVIEWYASDNVGIDHIGLYLYRGSGTSDAYKVDTTPYVPGGHSDGRLAANAYDLPDTGTYTWTVPTNLPLADDYRVKVVAWDDQLSNDHTDYEFTNYFAVTEDSARIVSLSAQPGSVFPADSLTLTATVANESGADFVQFVRDLNGDGQVNTGDSILGNANISGGTATWNVDTTGFSPGQHRFLARIRLADGTWGNRVLRKVTVLAHANQPPAVGSLAITPSTVVRGDDITLRATGVTDDTGVDYVQFLWDFDGNGDASTGDSLLGEDDTIVSNEASIIADSGRLDFGTQQILARARDVDGKWSDWVSDTVRVDPPTVPDPFIGRLDPSDTFLPQAITLTLTATDVRKKRHACAVLSRHEQQRFPGRPRSVAGRRR